MIMNRPVRSDDDEYHLLIRALESNLNWGTDYYYKLSLQYLASKYYDYTKLKEIGSFQVLFFPHGFGWNDKIDVALPCTAFSMSKKAVLSTHFMKWPLHLHFMTTILETWKRPWRIWYQCGSLALAKLVGMSLSLESLVQSFFGQVMMEYF